MPVLGRLAEVDAVPHVLAVAGAAFDCLVVPLLLWRRTRLPAWVALVAFHVCTWALFPIGVFPWLMIGASTVFFEPDWPRRLVARFAAPARLPRVAPVRRSVPLLVLAVLWVAVQVALPLRHLAYPGDHRWTRPGLPLRLERAAGGAGRLGDLPRARAQHGPGVGGRPQPSSTPATSCG